jgi:plastocyanin
MRAQRLAVALIVVVSACTTASSTASTSPATPTAPPPSVDLSSLVKGQIFPVGDQGDEARYTGTLDANNSSDVTIRIVAYKQTPAFEPTVIYASPGQTITVTVLQSDDLSAQFQHNFSIPQLGIDQDILPPGAGSSITVDVKVPASGELEYFCKYHASERHAGAFFVQG